MKWRSIAGPGPGKPGCSVDRSRNQPRARALAPVHCPPSPAAGGRRQAVSGAESRPIGDMSP